MTRLGTKSLESVHQMLVGSIVWLSEHGEGWSEEQMKAWGESFLTNVRLVYPPSGATNQASTADDYFAEPRRS